MAGAAWSKPGSCRNSPEPTPDGGTGIGPAYEIPLNTKEEKNVTRNSPGLKRASPLDIE